MGLGAIIGAITGISTLIDAGKSIYEQVTGKPSVATSAEDLKKEVEATTPEQQKAWSDNMSAHLDMYKAESERIDNDQGDIDASVLVLLDPPTRARVALLRMTTRPLVVLRCLRVVLLPFYITVYDMAAMTVNGLCRAFHLNGGDPILNLFAEKIFAPDSVYNVMYAWGASVCTGVIMSYMAAKTVEFVKSNPSTGDRLMSSVTSITSSVKSLLGKK